MNRSTRSTASCAFFVLVIVCATWLVDAPAAAAQESDVPTIDWPLELEAERGSVVIYQPQPESLEGDRLKARAAIAVKLKDKDAPMFGAVWFDARVATDMDTRTVTLEELKVTDAKLPEVEDPKKLDALKKFLETEIPAWDLVISLDRLLAGLDLVEEEQSLAQGLNNEPPEIIFVTEPTVLVLIDGEPILDDFEGADLKYVVNTAFMILEEPTSKRYYLKGGANWFVASEIGGEWVATKDLPKSVFEVAKQVEAEEKKLAEESAGSTPTASESGETIIPKIVVRTQPAELIQVRGEPDLASIEGTSLLYVANTENDIIMDIESQQYYVLLAGRWYASKSLAGGDWTFVPHDELPADFPKIPADSDMGSVRVSVAGTDEAKEAVLENSVPQTAVIDRNEAKVEVTYDGDPKFEKCGDGGVAYAVNTDKAVFLIDKTYYCCDEAVWFVSSGPGGPWQVATEVPKEIQSLPPDCPHYNVKYVYVYETTPEVVYVGYTPAYLGAYPWGGCVVYGSGFWYRPWYAHYYYPRPVTYGFGVHYNPYTGWGFSVSVTNGWMRVGMSWGSPYAYRGCWGPAGYRYGYRHGYAHGYHHGYHHGFRHGYNVGARAGYRAGYHAGQRTASANLYRQRPAGVRSTGGARPATRDLPARGTGAAARPAARPATTPAAKRTPKPAARPNDVYTDRSGNVYRKQGDSWQTRDKGNWAPDDRAARPQSRENLNREYQARQRGSQRTQDYRSNRPAQRPAQQPAQQPARPTQRPARGGGRSR